MTEKLKPCPACGGIAELKFAIHEILLIAVLQAVCKNCEKCGEEKINRKIATEAWNKGVEEAEQNENHSSKA